MPTVFYLGVKFRSRRVQDAFYTPLDAPGWCPRRPRSRPKGAQVAPRTAQELPQRPPDITLGQSRPKLPPDFDFGALWRRFGRILKSFWTLIFRRISKSVESIFSQLSACGAGWGGLRPPDPPLLEGKLGAGTRLGALKINMMPKCYPGDTMTITW